MPEQSNDQSPFPSFAELQHQHLQLMRELRGGLVSSSDEQRLARIRDFVEQTKSTGVILLADSEREAAQNILDYWSAETTSLTDISEANWRPAKLAPAKSMATAGGESAASSPQSGQQARKRIQLAAAARLWKDSQAPGYLLKGQALQEATRFMNDPDIAELVRASNSSVRSTRIIGVLASAVAVLLLIAFGLISYLLTQKVYYETDKANYEARSGDRKAEQLLSQLNLQQQKIEQLTAELSKARVTVSKEITETLPTNVSGSANAAPNTPGTVQRGYLWLGSEDKPNLLDPQTLAPVKPSAVRAGAQYKLAKNTVLRSGPPSDEYVQTNGIGVVPEQSLLKVTVLPAPYPRSTIQYWAAVEVENPNQPIVYMEYANGSPALAQSISQQLKTANFRVPGVESIDLAKGLNEIRFYYPSDADAAKRLATTIESIARDQKITGLTIPRVVDLTSKAGPRNFPGVIELWIDLPKS